MNRARLRRRLVLLTALVAVTAVPVTGVPPALRAQAPSIVKIVGQRHILVLRSDGSVVGWGAYNMGQLGPIAAVPMGRFRSTAMVTIPLPRKATDVAVSDETSFALLDDGSVVAWGGGRRGELGIGASPTLPKLSTSTQSMEYRGLEKPVRLPGIQNAVAIAEQLAILADGGVVTWGLQQPTPVRVAGLGNVTQASVGSGHVLALTKDGRVWSWGSNFYGALGRGERTEQPMPTPAAIPGLTDVVSVVAGLGVSTALKRDGTVWVWGANWNSQFGFGERTSAPGPTTGYVIEPQQIPGLAGVTSIALNISGRQTLALLKDGTVRAWGNNDWGQVGSGAGAGFRATPIAVKLPPIKTIFVAGQNSFAIQADGTVWIWGAGGTDEWPLLKNTRLPVKLELP